MSNKDTVHDLFTWCQALNYNHGDTRDADNAMLKQQLQRHHTGVLRHVLAVLLIAKENPEILDAAIAVVEKALE